MKLKKGDIILSVENQTVSNKKQTYQILSPLLKNKQKFSILINRKAKKLLISYQIVPYKKKKKIIVSGIKKIPLQKIEQKTVHTILSHKLENKKKSLVPEKYKPYMQRAYVSSLNSFVYQKPDFDSTKLYPLSIGKKILISKKIFRPPHNFGTFYKVFLFKEKKVVGYISEAEVISEFKKKDGDFIPNPSYKTAKKYKAENKILDLDSIEEIKKESATSQTTNRKSQTSNRKKYIGLTTGFLTANTHFAFPREDLFIGLALSGYNLLISYLNMDINFTSSFDWKRFYLDILTAYPLLKSSNYYMFVMGGLMGRLHLDKAYVMSPESIDYGVAGALSLLIPFNQNIAFKFSAKTVYEIRNRSIPFGFSGSLQVAF